MFFFIAGIQPKTVYLESQPRTCPSCGALQARLFRIDHYLSAFFIPLFRLKKGGTVLKCSSCGIIFDGHGVITGSPSRTNVKTCSACGNAVDPSHRFCPHCGNRL
ncbi:zinc ribbon domain-containing protein [Thermodesulfobacteriota bacterium]